MPFNVDDIPVGDTTSYLLFRMIDALTNIAAIEDKMCGGDWEEIEEARGIAKETLSLLDQPAEKLPHIYKVGRNWYCGDGEQRAMGDSPLHAFRMWQYVVLLAGNAMDERTRRLENT